MAIKFRVVGRKNPQKKNDPVKYYANTALDGEVGLLELCKEIEKISTVSEADILAVLSSLVAVVPDKLANGRIVRIGDLGDFRPSINSKGHDNEKEVTSASIKKSKIVFRAGKRIKNVIKVAEYKKVS